jgi:hypothetical protein
MPHTVLGDAHIHPSPAAIARMAEAMTMSKVSRRKLSSSTRWASRIPAIVPMTRAGSMSSEYDMTVPVIRPATICAGRVASVSTVKYRFRLARQKMAQVAQQRNNRHDDLGRQDENQQGRGDKRETKAGQPKDKPG